jgi:release factor glutamine methyltransferase
MNSRSLLVQITAQLDQAGCVAAEEEAAELIQAAGGDADRLAGWVARRSQGEPLAWLVGSVQFCGVTVRIHDGVYVPRWQSEGLAMAAVARLPDRGTAVDLCTGSGAVALVMADRRPHARIVATEIDSVALACARDNGVDVIESNMAQGLPATLLGQVDVVSAVVPYVPTNELRFLPSDTLRYEPMVALDGGADGLDLLTRAAHDAASLLRPGGSLLLELGGDEADHLAPTLTSLGFGSLVYLTDTEGDLRAIACEL